MTLCAAIHLLRLHHASLRYLPRQRAWRIIRHRQDGTVGVMVAGSLEGVFRELQGLG